MGRPLNKKYFKPSDGNQLQIRAKIGAAAEGDGYIVKQTGSSRYIATVGNDTGVVYLVDKANGSLAENEATITFVNEDSDTKRVKKVMSHRAVFFDETGAPWSFDTAANGVWQATDNTTEVVEAVITIDTQPVDASAVTGTGTSFTVDASIDPSGTLTYQWQEDAGAGFVDVTDAGVYAGATTDTLTISDVTGLDTYSYQVIVDASDIGAVAVTSNAAVLTETGV